MSESGLPMKVVNGNGVVTGQVDVGNTPTLIAAAREGRRSLGVSTLGVTDVFLGDENVTAASGFRLPAAIVVPTERALYGITAIGTQRVSFIELF